MAGAVMRAALIAGTIAVSMAAACRRATEPAGVFCTEVFVMKTIYVRDVAGAPVSDATIRTTLLRTGEELVPHSLGLMVPGNYIIVDDGARTAIRRTGDDIRVTGASASGGFSADYVFNVPEGCHINKVSGPDTVTVN